MGGFFIAVLRRQNSDTLGTAEHAQVGVNGKRAAPQEAETSAPDAKRVKVDVRLFTSKEKRGSEFEPICVTGACRYRNRCRRPRSLGTPTVEGVRMRRGIDRHA